MPKLKMDLMRWITEAQALVQSGLAYSKDQYDQERFKRLRTMLAELTGYSAETNFETVDTRFSLETGYATPKIDVRAFILKDNKVLMVKERSDELWTLPGGWADVNESASEAAVREAREETGFSVSAIRLLALWDKQKHDHPPQWPHTYKCFFQCEICGGNPKINQEISEIDFFDIKQLPPLSKPRITEKQLETLYAMCVQQIKETAFD